MSEDKLFCAEHDGFSSIGNFNTCAHCVKVLKSQLAKAQNEKAKEKRDKREAESKIMAIEKLVEDSDSQLAEKINRVLKG